MDWLLRVLPGMRRGLIRERIRERPAEHFQRFFRTLLSNAP